MNKEKSVRVPITYTSIGVVHSEHVSPEETPIQPLYAKECVGRVELFAEYSEGLKDLDGFSHIILVYHMHRAKNAQLTVRPFIEDTPKGLFATRHPLRPNPIGLSTVRLLKIEKTTLFVQGLDILDGTPVLDIKPYIPRFDAVEESRGGWTEAVSDETARERGCRNMKKK